MTLHQGMVCQQPPSAVRSLASSMQCIMVDASHDSGGIKNIAFAIVYKFSLKINIAFVGQPVFQSFATNVVVLEEKMVNEGLRRFFLVNGKRIRQLQQRFACLKKATFRLLFFC